MGWDGSERRAAMMAAEQAQGNGRRIDISNWVVAVGFATVALLQCGALWGHVVLAGEQHRENEEARQARRQISCFVVGITQQKPGSELLVECGFVTIGGK